VKFLLMFPEPEELNNTSYYKYYIISILLIYNIKCRSAALHFARQEREIYVIYSHKIRSIRKFANKGLELIKLILYKSLSPKSYRIIRLRTLTNNKDRIILAFISIFNQALKVYGTVYN
jgi:hypothetical protein